MQNSPTSQTVKKDIALVEDIKTTKVDNATNADKVANSFDIYLKYDPTNVTYEKVISFDGSEQTRISFSGNDFYKYSIVADSGYNGNQIGLTRTGVKVGSYSAVTVDEKGRVKAGGKSVEWGTSGQNAPSDDLMVGGLFFELQ